MKNRVVCFCAIILSFLSVPVFSQVTDITNNNYGVWQTFGDPVSSSINPEIRGRLCNFRWADIQPAADTWDWKNFDNNLAERANDGLPIIFMVYTEEDAPEWLYTKGIPKVMQKDKKGNIVGFGPYYEDAAYKNYFKDMVKKVREHIETLPAPVRKQIIAVQACFGSTGDYISYKGDVDPQYKIGNSAFYALFQEFSQFFYDEYQSTSPKIYVLNNPKNNGPDQASWLFKNCPGGWMKVGSIGKGYQLNDELTKSAWLYPMLNKEIFNGEYVRSRSEIIGGSTKSGWWTKAPAKNMFALMCYGIFWGLDWSNQGYDQISNKIYDSSFGFYNRYAGEKDPAKSAFAMCALKDALDAADKKRFPENGYGMAQRGNKNRYIKIANEYTPYGAQLDDVYTAMSDEIGNISADGTNDVGWDLFPGNYDRYIHQIKANETSAGYWNIESADKNDMYGKFGRGFDLAKGKDALYFNIEDSFFNNAPLNSQQPVVVEIVYFDNSKGSWQLIYDGSDNADKVALTIIGTNSKLWKKTSITIHDGYFGNRGKNGADFYIKNTGSENVIFSIVELRRPYSDETMGLSASKLKPFSTSCGDAVSYQNLYVSGSFMPAGNTIVGPLKGFGFSLDSGQTYPDSVIIKNHAAQFNTKIFVKFRPDKEGVYNGNIPVRDDNATPVFVSADASSINSSPELKSLINSVSCFGKNDGSVDLTCNGGVGPFTFSWSGISNFKAITEDISNLAPGTYNVTVNSPGGCVTKAAVEIKSPTALQVKASATEIPYDQVATDVKVVASGGTAPYSGVGNFSTSEGSYTYTVKDANACTANADIVVTRTTAALAAFASSNVISCHGGFTTITIGASGGNGPYTGTGDYIVSAGTYTYTVKDAKGIANSVTVVVTEPPVLNASVTNNVITCNGGTANIEVAATGGIAPYTGIGNFTSGAGISTYTVTDAKGCKAVKTINLAEPEPLIVNVNAEPIIDGKTTTTVIVTATGGSSPYQGIGNFTESEGVHNYIITDANGCESNSSINIANTIPAVLSATATNGNILCAGGTTTVTVDAIGGVGPYTGTGTYTVTSGTYTYTVKDALGHVCHANVVIPEPVSLSISVANTADLASCKGLSSAITVNAAGGTMPYQYNLNGGSYQSIGEFGNLADGSYTVIVKDKNGCITSMPATVAKTAPMAAWFSDITDVSTCGFADGSVTIASQGGVAPFMYSIDGETYQSSNIFKKLPENDYTVSITDSRGCETSALTTVGRNSELKLTITNNLPVSGCSNNNGELTVSGSGGGGSYQYCVNGQPFKGHNVFSGLTEGTYEVTVRDGRGCMKSITTTVVKTATLVANIQTIANAGACGNDGLLKVGLLGGTAPYMYSVNGGALQSSNTFDALAAGIYKVQVTDSRGCVASAMATIGKTAQILIKADTTAIMCKGGATGTITISNIGGIAPYEYSIDGKLFSTKNVFGNINAGKHIISVKDSKGCVASIDVKMADGSENCAGGIPGVFNPLDTMFKVRVLPNPSPTTFTLVVNSRSTEKLDLIVIDINGRIVYKTSGAANQAYKFGNEFASGTYMVRVMQGQQVANVTIIKTRGQ